MLHNIFNDCSLLLKYCIILYMGIFTVYRHSKEMINRLENAGLGFYVKSTKTIHKIGM